MLPAAKHNRKQIIKVVISGGLGDCLLATPFIRYFRNSGKYDKVICAFPKPALELFDCNPYIDQLIPCSGRELFFWAVPENDCDVFSPYLEAEIAEMTGSRIDVRESYLLNPNLTPIPVVRQVANYYGLVLEDDRPDIFVTDEDEKWAEDYFKRWKGKRTVLLNTQSRLKEKNISQTLAQEIVDGLSGQYIIIQLGHDVLDLENTEVVAPMPGIRRSAALFKRLNCVITVDSFPGHLAHALGTPAVVLFGPSNPETFGHSGNRNIRTSSCPPCGDTERKKDCKRSLCLEDIPSAIIIDAVLSFEKS